MSPSQLKYFHTEGLTPTKMATIQLVLGSMNIKLVKYCENGIRLGNISAHSLDKVYSRRKNKPLFVASRLPYVLSPRFFLGYFL